MKTAIEILQEQFDENTYNGLPHKGAILTAMVEYASQFKCDSQSLEKRKETFALSLKDYSEIYPREMLKEFYNYWCEHSPTGKKMRFEKEKVFDVKKRLIRWGRNSKPNTKAKAGIEEMLSVNQLAKNGVSDTE